MDRRKLVIAFLAVAAVSFMPNIQVFRSANPPRVTLARNKRKKSHNMESGEIYDVEEDTAINLPFTPKDGDFVYLTIRSDSLEKPALIDFYESKIAGQREPLILDTLANIKLTFHSATNNWRLG